MDTSIDNNQFEVKPIKSKRKIVAPCPNVYLNPALDLLANEDPMCNNAMEIIPVKKRKRTRSCEAAFENTALDIGISKAAVNEFLKRELDNVRKNVKPFSSADPIGCHVEVTRSDFFVRNVVEDTSSLSDVGLPVSRKHFLPKTVPMIDTPILNSMVLPSGTQSKTDILLKQDFLTINGIQTTERASSLNDVGLPLPDNMPSYDIVGLPTADNMSDYYDTPYSTGTPQFQSFERSLPTSEAEAKVVAIVEPRMNVSEPIYANLSELNIIPRNTEKNVLDNTENLVAGQSNCTESFNTQNVLKNTDNIVACSTKFLDNVETQNGMEISNIEDPITDLDSDISTVKPKETCPEFGKDIDLSAINKTGVQTNITNQVFINNNSNINLSFIDRLALDSPATNQSLCLDDDLNESNIMEIKTITIITKKKRIPIPEKKKITNPFLDPYLTEELNNIESNDSINPFLNIEVEKNVGFNDETKQEQEYNDEVINRPIVPQTAQVNTIMPRRLFIDTNSTVSTINESTVNQEQNEYENIDEYRSESPIYENLGEFAEDLRPNYEKQSRILGCDVSQFSALDIMNINRNKSNSSNESNDSKKDFKHQILKAGKLSKKVFKSLKKTFSHDKVENKTLNITNPYEVPRKMPKMKTPKNDSGIENPALKLDISDETDDEDLDEEHQYETIKTLRNTRLNMNVTPLKERHEDNIDNSHNKTSTPGKKVRFDSTLNKEKVITGNSFDYSIQSPGFDAKIDKFQDELENCINEKKFIQQNM